MEATEAVLTSVFAWVWRSSGQASVLVGLVLGVQWLWRHRLTARWRYALWLLVLTRLMVPFAPTSAFSIFNLTRFSPVARLEAATPRDAGQSRGSGAALASRRLAKRENASVTAAAMPAQSIVGEANRPASLPNSPAPPAMPPPRVWSWNQVLLAIWLGGAGIVALRFGWETLRFARRIRGRAPSMDGRMIAVMDECRQVMDVRRAVRIIETDATGVPAMFGFLRPRLLLPHAFGDRFSREELRLIFFHELAHFKRGDLIVNWLLILLNLLHWFNPVIWLAFARLRGDRELACDELVLRLSREEESQPYGRIIIKLMEEFAEPARRPGLVGVLEDHNQMERRIRMIAKFKKTQHWPVFAMGLLLALGLIALTDAQSPSEPSKPAAAGATATSPAANQAAALGDLNNPPVSAPETGDVIDPTNGLKYVVANRIAGTNDVIEHQNRIVASPNGKFLLWWGHVVPADGRPAFELKELKGAGIASWSPDGRKIAFNSEGIQVLPVAPETGQPAGAARKLLEEKEDWFRGRIYWSADSERILYVKWNRQMQHEAGTLTLRDGHLNQPPNYADFGRLSPDGKTTAYSVSMEGIWARPTSGEPPWLARGRSGGWLFDDPVLWTSDSQWVLSAVGGWMREEIHLTRLSDRQGFDVFPPEAAGTFVGQSTDGQKLRFYRSSFDLRMTTKVVPVSAGPAFNVGQSFDDLENHFWSMDSASLAVHGMDNEGQQQLWSVPLKGADSVRFKLESLGTNVVWLWLLSPDSKKLLYARESGSNPGNRRTDLYVVPISLHEGRATDPAKLVYEGWQHPSAGTETRLAWSPDGAKIVMPTKGEQMGDLWILSAEGGKPIQITHTPGEVEQFPQWSPNGAMLAFNLHASDRETLQVIPAEGGTPRTILTTPPGELPPYAWSPDNKELVVARDGLISGFPVTGGSARVILRLPAAGYESAAWLGWSPDGQRLAFQGRKTGELSRLCLFSPSTGAITTLDNTPPIAWDFRWSPDSQLICCKAEEAVKKRPSGVVRELDVATAVLKAQSYLATASPTNSRPPEYSGPTNPPPMVNGEFRDNFDSGDLKNWDFQDPPTEGSRHEHGIKSGELVLENTRANIGSPNWTNYVVNVRLCVKSGKGSQTLAGLGFRRGKAGTYFLCPEPFDQDLWLGIGFRDPNGAFRVGKITSQLMPFALDKWYTLQAEVRGNKIRASVDGKLIIEAEDDRMAHGYVGLLAGNCRVHYDDFSLRLLP